MFSKLLPHVKMFHTDDTWSSGLDCKYNCSDCPIDQKGAHTICELNYNRSMVIEKTLHGSCTDKAPCDYDPCRPMNRPWSVQCKNMDGRLYCATKECPFFWEELLDSLNGALVHDNVVCRLPENCNGELKRKEFHQI